MKDVNIGDDNLFSIINNINYKYEICHRYKEPKPKPIVSFPIAKTFNEIVALDLKQRSPDTLFFTYDRSFNKI